MDNLRYFLALNRMYGIGNKITNILLSHFPDLEELFKLSQPQLENTGLPAQLAQQIVSFNLNLVSQDLAWREAASSHHLIPFTSENYPRLLKEIADPPLILYADGDLSSFNQAKISIVGSRNPTITGLENANFFAKKLAAEHIAIVSGLALGIDGQAHRGCLEAGGKTIAVLGTGIDTIYPRQHLKLAENIRQKGLLITEFPLKSPPIAGHFPRRNRIISGLSSCTLIIEAAIKSGSLITARMAMEQNRDVLAIPGSIHNPLAQGCHYLLQQGAKLVTTVADVLEELNLKPSKLTKEVNFSLVNKDETLVKWIGFEMTTIDQIVLRSGYNVERVMSELVELEMHGLITSVPGGYIRRAHER